MYGSTGKEAYVGKLSLLIITLALTGCSSFDIAYQTVSITSGITTGKTLTEHAISQVTGADCRATNIVNGLYPCEQARTPDSHYNRNPI